MKKLSIVIASLIVCICSIFLVGCGNKDKKSITTLELTNLQNYYTTDSTIDFSKIQLVVTYSDKTKATLTKSEIDVETPTKEDTEFLLFTDGLASQTPGEMTEKEYTISAEVVGVKKSKKEIMKVVVFDDLSNFCGLDHFDVPEELQLYKTRLDDVAENDKSDENEDKFMVKDTTYVVGDDNPYIFKPDYILFSKTSNTTPDISIPVELTVTDVSNNEVVEEGTFYTFDNSTFGIQFKDNESETVIGKSFKLSMMPKDFTETDDGETINVVEHTVTVADGWNVYKAEDLGRMSINDETEMQKDYWRKNCDFGTNFFDAETGKSVQKDIYKIWENYFKAQGITDLKPINGLYLHKDIKVDETDLPDDYLISQKELTNLGGAQNARSALGTLRDGAYLYMRSVKNGEKFDINGNYFNINFTNIEVCHSYTEGGGTLSIYPDSNAKYKFGHACAFAIGGLNDEEQMGSIDVTMKNISMIGNSGKALSGTDVSKNAGALIMFNAGKGVHAKSDNVIAKEFLFAFNCESTDNVHTIDHTKVYDCFNCALYDWGSEGNIVRNSVFKRFGGPAFMTISTVGGNDKSSFEIENTIIESWVTADQAWFTLTPGAASVVTQFMALNEKFQQFGKTILDEKGECFNMMDLASDTDYFSADQPNIFTKFDFKDNDHTTDFDTAALKEISTQYNGAAILQDNDGNTAYTNMADIFGFSAGTTFTGDKLFVYLPVPESTAAFGIIIELKPYTPPTPVA